MSGLDNLRGLPPSSDRPLCCLFRLNISPSSLQMIQTVLLHWLMDWALSVEDGPRYRPNPRFPGWRGASWFNGFLCEHTGSLMPYRHCSVGSMLPWQPSPTICAGVALLTHSLSLQHLSLLLSPSLPLSLSFTLSFTPLSLLPLPSIPTYLFLYHPHK